MCVGGCALGCFATCGAAIWQNEVCVKGMCVWRYHTEQVVDALDQTEEKKRSLQTTSRLLISVVGSLLSRLHHNCYLSMPGISLL